MRPLQSTAASCQTTNDKPVQSSDHDLVIWPCSCSADLPHTNIPMRTSHSVSCRGYPAVLGSSSGAGVTQRMVLGSCAALRGSADWQKARGEASPQSGAYFQICEGIAYRVPHYRQNALHIRCSLCRGRSVEVEGQVMVLSRQALHMLRQGSSQPSHSSCSSSASLVSCSIAGRDCQPMSCQCISDTVTDKRLAQSGRQALPAFARLSRPTLGWCGRLTAHPAAAG